MGQYMKRCAIEREKLVRVGVGEGAVSVQAPKASCGPSKRGGKSFQGNIAALYAPLIRKWKALLRLNDETAAASLLTPFLATCFAKTILAQHHEIKEQACAKLKHAKSLKCKIFSSLITSTNGFLSSTDPIALIFQPWFSTLPSWANPSAVTGLDSVLTLLGAGGWTPEVLPNLNDHDFMSLWLRSLESQCSMTESHIIMLILEKLYNKVEDRYKGLTIFPVLFETQINTLWPWSNHVFRKTFGLNNTKKKAGFFFISSGSNKNRRRRQILTRV